MLAQFGVRQAQLGRQGCRLESYLPLVLFAGNAQWPVRVLLRSRPYRRGGDTRRDQRASRDSSRPRSPCRNGPRRTPAADCDIARACEGASAVAVSYTHLRAHETPEHLVCRLLLEKKKK